MKVEIFPLGPISTNAILLTEKEGKRAWLFDAPPGAFPFLEKRLEELSLEKIFLTHSHWDHIADIAPIAEKTGAPVYVHVEDAGNMRSPGTDGLRPSPKIRGVAALQEIVGGEEFFFGTARMVVLHTPGHSRGSVCYHFPEEKLLIAGDTLFRGSYGRLDLATSVPEKMKGSLSLLSQLPPDTRVVSGHGDETTVAEERWLGRLGKIDF